jgi:hypothetical protein
MFNALTAAAVSLIAIAGSVSYSSTTGDGPDQVPASLDWQVSPAGNAAPAGAVQFEFGYQSAHHSSRIGDDVALATLDGLTPAQLAAAGQPVAFVLHRDAGDFRCKGVAGEGKGIGTCVFAAKAEFTPALAKRGVAAPDGFQQFQLAMNDIGLGYVDELKREGYATPAVDDLVRAGTHGAGMKQLTAMDAAGYRFGDVATLVRMRDHGVSAKYIGTLKDFGYVKLPAEQLQQMRDHGVSTIYLTELKAHGYTGLPVADLVRMRDHGVSVSFIADLEANGYKGLTPDVLARLRDHGVSAKFVRTSNQGAQHLDPEALIRLRDRGGRD